VKGQDTEPCTQDLAVSRKVTKHGTDETSKLCLSQSHGAEGPEFDVFVYIRSTVKNFLCEV